MQNSWHKDRITRKRVLALDSVDAKSLPTALFELKVNTNRSVCTGTYFHNCFLKAIPSHVLTFDDRRSSVTSTVTISDLFSQ